MSFAFDAKEPGLELLWRLQGQWSQNTFGSDAVRGPQGSLKHLAKEVQEALAEPTDLKEYVDILFLAFDATRRAGFTFDELVAGCFAKLKTNQARTWPAFDPTKVDEAVEHVRGDEIGLQNRCNT